MEKFNDSKWRRGLLNEDGHVECGQDQMLYRKCWRNKRT